MCPYCGIPLSIRGRSIETESGNLSNLSALRDRARTEKLELTRLAKLRYLKDRLQEAKRRGYKPGHARHLYEAKYKEPVPRDWMPLEWQAEHPVSHLDSVKGGLYV